MNKRFHHSLTEGDFSNGKPLCQSLVEGDFWPRRTECYNIYRGCDHPARIDYENIISCVDNKTTLNLPNYMTHENATDYFYAARATSATGKEEQNTTAITRLRLDRAGQRILPHANHVRHLAVDISFCNEIVLSWSYWPIAQQSPPAKFRIYSNNGQDAINYNTPLKYIDFSDSRYYRVVVGSYDKQLKYLFSVRSVAANGREDANTTTVEI